MKATALEGTGRSRVQIVVMRSRARRIRLSGLLALCLLCGSSVKAPPTIEPTSARVYRGTFQAAEARWLVRSGRGVTAYLVFAYRMDKPLKSSRSFVIADRSRCRMHGAKRRLASCSFGARRRELPIEALRFDPMLSGAQLSYRGLRVRWVGGELQEPMVDPWVESDLMEADAYLERLSVAQGRALGDRMKQKTLDHATLSYGAYAGAMLDQGPRRTTITFRLPRGF